MYHFALLLFLKCLLGFKVIFPISPSAPFILILNKDFTDAMVEVVIGGASIKVADGVSSVASDIVNSESKTVLSQASKRIKKTATGSKNNVVAQEAKAAAESTIESNKKALDAFSGSGIGVSIEDYKNDRQDYFNQF